MCKSKKVKEEYENIQEQIHREYNTFSIQEKVVIAEVLEELEMAIE